LTPSRILAFVGSDGNQSCAKPPALEESQARLGRSHACAPRDHEGRGLRRVRPGREVFLQLRTHHADALDRGTSATLCGAALPKRKGTQGGAGFVELLFQACE
jgi:hypothetical protein